MSFGPNDSGILEFKTEKETEEYIKELGPKFKYGCYRQGDPVQCHSLARWYASYMRDYRQSEEVFLQNCFQRQFSDSCVGYAFYKLFGASGIKRDAKQAFEALKFGCDAGGSAKCCQGTGELLLEGVAEKKNQEERITDAMKYFTRGCDLGLPISCFFLGGLCHRQSEASGMTNPSERSQLRHSAVLAWVKACQMVGHELACRNAAMAYRLGDGVDQNESKANELETLMKKYSS
nr:sel1 repeat containing protein 1B [Hymenolepis microstoma]